MKTLKLKAFVSCFLLALTCSFLIISCTTDEIETQEIQEQLINEKGLLLPLIISEKGEEFVNQHVADLSNDLEITYRNNFTVGQHLTQLGKADLILNNLSKSDNLSEVDFTKHLSSEQIEVLESEMIEALPEIEARGCTKIFAWNNCCWRNQWNQCVGCWKHVGWDC